MVLVLSNLSSFLCRGRRVGSRALLQTSKFTSSSCKTATRFVEQRVANVPLKEEESDDRQLWLVVGDGDLSYSAAISEQLEKSNIRLVATVLEDQEIHRRVYRNSASHTERISNHQSHDIRFGIDATQLQSSFPTTLFDCIEFNFPHWRGKTNHKYNRQLLDSFLKSASEVLKPSGEIRVALCEGQGGMPASSIEEWRQSWMPALYAAEHGLLLQRYNTFEPDYDLSSHRGVDRSFHIGKSPQRYIFTFPDHTTPVERVFQISCRHELRIMLHPDLLEKSPCSFDDIVHGTALFDLAQQCIPKGIRFEIRARDLLPPTLDRCLDHVPLAIFLLNYSGEYVPLTRQHADEIRVNIEAAVVEQWLLKIAKGTVSVSRPYPYQLLNSLIGKFNK
jgi:hypothetical protein